MHNKLDNYTDHVVSVDYRQKIYLTGTIFKKIGIKPMLLNIHLMATKTQERRRTHGYR
jgi:hypothetical protein